MHRYIITGGPGAGKTSLLTTLQNYGYPCSAEVSRALIMEELAKSSRCLPWLDLNCFAEKALERMISSYHMAADQVKVAAETETAETEEAENDLVFFDRGIPDIIAYLSAAGLPVTEKYITALHQYPYQKTVFLLRPWQSIYVKDPARWQTFEEAETICRNIEETYQSAGYHIIELPEGTVGQRAQFVQRYIRTLANAQ
jgi:predicted ATPase